MVFVDAVVCEVDVRVLQILLGRFLIILNAKSCESFLVEVADIGTHRRNQHKESQIKLLFL